MKREISAMIQRSLAACIALVGIQSTFAEEITVLSFPNGETPSVITALLEVPQLLHNTTNKPSHESCSCSQAFVPEGTEALLQRKLSEAARLQGEILQLRAELGKNQQILVKVKMLEVSLTKLKKLGVDFSSPSDGSFKVIDISSLQKALGTNVAALGQGSYTPNAKEATGFLERLVENRVARVLADPSIATVSARPAQFFVGRELPIPAGDNRQRVTEFQKCGTELNVLALTLNDNRVQLQIRARVSEPEATGSIVIDGSNISALRVRECDTSIETKFGEPVVLNGLVEKRVETSKTESGIRDEVNEVALVIIVTPEIVTTPKYEVQPANAKVRE
jgi:Flp pilus assembly secretin CpaC